MLLKCRLWGNKIVLSSNVNIQTGFYNASVQNLGFWYGDARQKRLPGVTPRIKFETKESIRLGGG